MTDHIDEAISKAEKLLEDYKKGKFSFSGNLCIELAEAVISLNRRLSAQSDILILKNRETRKYETRYRLRPVSEVPKGVGSELVLLTQDMMSYTVTGWFETPEAWESFLKRVYPENGIAYWFPISALTGGGVDEALYHNRKTA